MIPSAICAKRTQRNKTRDRMMLQKRTNEGEKFKKNYWNLSFPLLPNFLYLLVLMTSTFSWNKIETDKFHLRLTIQFWFALAVDSQLTSIACFSCKFIASSRFTCTTDLALKFMISSGRNLLKSFYSAENHQATYHNILIFNSKNTFATRCNL